MAYFHGSTVVSSSTTYQLTADDVDCLRITIKAWTSNTGIVYVGRTGVTAGTATATDGWPLGAKESITLQRAAIGNPSLVYMIASTTANQVSWGYIT